MEAALGWLGEIANALIRVFPILVIIRSTHRGVKFSGGKTPKVMSPGLHILWPLITEYEIVPVVRQTAALATQYLETKDGFQVGVGGMVVYEVDDALALLTECWDHEETINDLASAAIKKAITTNDYGFFANSPRESDVSLGQILRKDLKRFGIKTVRFTLTDFTKARIFAHWGLNVTTNVE